MRVSEGETDAFVVAFDAEGRYEWDWVQGERSTDHVSSIASDGDGNTLVVGALGSGGYVRKLSSDGVELWSQSIPGYPAAVAVDTDGSVVVGGDYGSGSFGGPTRTAVDWVDVFVARYHSDGTYDWDQTFEGGNAARATSVAIDPTGHIVVGGWFIDQIDLGSGLKTSGRDRNGFLVALAGTGVPLWDVVFGGNGRDVVTSVAAEGSVWVTGNFQNSVDFGGGIRTSAGDRDIFVFQRSDSGEYRWDRTFGGSGRDEGVEVIVGASGSATVVGTHLGRFDFGGGFSDTPAGVRTGFFLGLSVDGAYAWDHRVDGAVMTDAAGNGSRVVVTGSFSGTRDFGGGPRTSMSGSVDVFAIVMEPRVLD